ncbi:MAG: 4Fe-4S dicluster domain-containing protein [bacterium]
MIVKADDLFAFLQKVSLEKIDGFSEIILPVKPKYSKNGDTFFSTMSVDANFILDSYRTVDPVKVLFYLVREQMLSENKEVKKRIIVGVKQCDLKALEVIDTALINKDFIDPRYKLWRENTIIISSDCGKIGENCYCNLMDGKPYAQKGFDVNLSRINDCYLMEAGSQKGKQFLEMVKKHINYSDAQNTDAVQVQTNRGKVVSELEQKNSNLAVNREYINLRMSEMQVWKDESLNCVGCGSCTNICPTCYCLILNDETEAQKFVKVRSYDSCQYNGYARVAGGGTPRPKMFERFRNRYLCKFLYMKSNFDIYGCTGCGRCTETCPGKINFMKAVKNIIENKAESVQQ